MGVFGLLNKYIIMITVKLQGGIGNQMFQYAAAKSLAEKNKTAVALDLTTLNHRLPGRNYVFRSFDLDLLKVEAQLTTLSKLSLKLPNFSFLLARAANLVAKKLRPAHYLVEKENYFFDEKIMLATAGTYLDGFWQSFRYFEGIEELLRREFAFKNKLSGPALAMAKEIANTNSVCVNVRRDDYVSNATNLQFFGAMDEAYFMGGVEVIGKKVDAAHYFIFSDDLEWARKNFNFLENKTIVGIDCNGERYGDKFHLMTLCKHFIIPNSTFAWWGAWLGNHPDKVVVAPKYWVRDEKLNANTKDLIPEDWIRI